MTPTMSEEFDAGLDDVFMLGAFIVLVVGGVGLALYKYPLIVAFTVGSVIAFIVASFVVGFGALWLEHTIQEWSDG